MATCLLKIGVPRPNEKYVEIGKVILKRTTLFFRDEKSREEFVKTNNIRFQWSYAKYDHYEADLETCLRALFPNAIVTCVRSGKWEGYGHGYETITASNGDGTLIYKCDRVARCEGPGYSCSYDHGPWFEYGQSVTCPVAPETRLAEAVLMYFDGKYPSIELKKLALKAFEEVA